jgi:peroxiredoxin Q/BCP
MAKKTTKKKTTKKAAKQTKATKKVATMKKASKKVAKKATKKVAKKATKKVAKKATKKVAKKATKKVAKKATKKVAKKATKKAATKKTATKKVAAPVVDVVSNLPQVGESAPEFQATATDGSTVNLASFRGQSNVVLYFYPKDDTPGCTVEACSFNNASTDYSNLNTVVIGVSPDGSESHKRFTEKFNLNGITLISDEQNDVSQKYGVWVEKNNYGRTYMGVQRSTFLIGKDGRLRAVWPSVKVDGHADEVLKIVSSLGAE